MQNRFDPSSTDDSRDREPLTSRTDDLPEPGARTGGPGPSPRAEDPDHPAAGGPHGPRIPSR